MFDWRDPGRAAIALGLGVIIIFISVLAAQARWKPEYAELPKEARDWYASRELTPAAQQRFNFKSCCSQSDVVKTKFKVGGAGNDQWFWLDDGGQWKRVPDDIIHWDQHAPSGEPVLFAVGGNPVCFFPPESGI